MKGYVAVGLAALGGAALIEAALIPGLVIGGAAFLAPTYLPKLRRQLKPVVDSMTRPTKASAAAPKAAKGQTAKGPAAQGQAAGAEKAATAATISRLGIKQAVAKTITFRVIVTTLDFTTNYIVIGELTTAAGLSTFNLIVGPLFYLGHEAAWNYLGPPEDAAVDVTVPLPQWAGAKKGDRAGLTVSRALAKTITFRTIATIMDFTVNYVVVRDVVTAAGLSAFAFVVGPFVYLGHEKLWDYYGSPKEQTPDEPKPVKLLPAPG
jgi:uncharacterized membrane protein